MRVSPSILTPVKMGMAQMYEIIVACVCIRDLKACGVALEAAKSVWSHQRA